MATRRKKKTAARKRVARKTRTSKATLRHDGEVTLHRTRTVTYRFEGTVRSGKTITIGTNGGIIVGSRFA